jgi:hypothetical protein
LPGRDDRRLLQVRGGQVIEAASPDDLFSDLLRTAVILDQLGGTAVDDSHGRGPAQGYLPDPVRRIDLYDLVMEKVDVVAKTIERQAKSPTLASYEMVDPVLDDYL